MQSEHRQALIKNFVLLVNEMPVEEVLHDLISVNIITDEMAEFISSKPTRKERARNILGILPRRGPNAFMAFCRSLLTNNRRDLVSVIGDPDVEDMEVVYPVESRFDLGKDTRVLIDGDVIQLIQGPVTINFPLFRWKELEGTMEEILNVTERVRNNRWAHIREHLGGNIYVTAGNESGEYVDIRRYWYSHTDDKKYPTEHGVRLSYGQFETLIEIAKIIRDLIPNMDDVRACYETHQNVEGAMMCSECNPDSM